jgi:hypothetical protein
VFSSRETLSNASNVGSIGISDSLKFVNLQAAFHRGEQMRKNARAKQGEHLYEIPRIAFTKAMYFLVDDYIAALNLFIYTVSLASRADDNALRAAKALMKVGNEDDQQKYKTVVERLENGKGAFGKLTEFRATNSRHLLTTIVDSFYCYLSHIIRYVLTRQPTMLRSSEKVSVEGLLDFKTRADLVSYLADRKVNELSYGGIKGIEKYMQDVFGIDMFSDEKSRDLLVIFSELRNIHVHNRGYINNVFLGRVKDHRNFKFERNKRFVLDLDDILLLSNNVMEVSLRLDTLVARKFRLNRKRYGVWKKAPPKYL